MNDKTSKKKLNLFSCKHYYQEKKLLNQKQQQEKTRYFDLQARKYLQVSQGFFSLASSSQFQICPNLKITRRRKKNNPEKKVMDERKKNDNPAWRVHESAATLISPKQHHKNFLHGKKMLRTVSSCEKL